MHSLSDSSAPSPAPARANGAARRAPRVSGARAIAALQWLVTLLLGAFLIVPVVMSVLAGLTVNYFRGLSSGLTLRWLEQVWQQYHGSVVLSLVVAFATLAIVLAVGVPAGYALARSKGRFARVIEEALVL
ncbi:ABC transporter permease, partial [Burkholderia ubonensis]